MNTEHNIEVAKNYLKAVGNRDVEAVAELMTEDATWWIIPGTKFSGDYKIKDFLAGMPAFFALATGDFEFEILQVLAQDDQVAIVAKGNMPLKSGANYNSDYSFFFTFRDGKILSGREYLDGVLVNKIFGAPEHS